MSSKNLLLVTGWNDNLNYLRIKIVRDVQDIMSIYFRNDALFRSPLLICLRSSVNCLTPTTVPCTHPDRRNICITSTNSHWCQFVYQLSHELCHCSTSQVQLPQKIKWFDEFICCCSSFLVETHISKQNDTKYNYMFGSDTSKNFYEYLNSQQIGHIYQKTNISDFFKNKREEYEKNENLIKSHDFYVNEFFRKIGESLKGLSFVGKMRDVPLYNCDTIEDYLSRLSFLCNSEEIETLKVIVDLFGLALDL